MQLKPDNGWLPSFMSLKGEEEDKKILLQVMSIDTGAGEVTFDNPVTVAYIVTDSLSNSCIDDPRGTKKCELGTDYQDCGPVGADNFTKFDSVDPDLNSSTESTVRSTQDLEEKHRIDNIISNANITTTNQ